MSNSINQNGDFVLGVNTGDVINFGDIQALYNFYQPIMGSSITTPVNGMIYLEYFTNLISQLQSFMNDHPYTVDNTIMNTLRGRINNQMNDRVIYNSYVWPHLVLDSIVQDFYIYETTTFNVPVGCTSISVIAMIGGGGGGGGGNGVGPWFVGGAGGSAGYYQNYTLDVSANDSMTFTVGEKGIGVPTNCAGWTNNNGATNGGDSVISKNGSAVLTATGGRAGGNTSGSAIAAGAGGSPGGSAGRAGWKRGAHKENKGPTGASSPYGSGGTGGMYTSGNCTDCPGVNGCDSFIKGDATGYGAGGGGGGMSDHVHKYTPGGDGSPGFYHISLKAPIGWTP